jgi:Spondin_N
MNRRAIVFRTALAALALGGVAASIWAALDVRGDVAASAPSRASECRAPEAAASYRVTFVSTWSAQTHPESFPADAHYSGLHGATHHAGWSLWHSGPSPDWFVGVSALDLCEGGHWAAERTVELFAYDAGTDSGPSYESPDADTQPREPIRRIETPPFRIGGALRAVGTLTFSRT